MQWLKLVRDSALVFVSWMLSLRKTQTVYKNVAHSPWDAVFNVIRTHFPEVFSGT